MRIYSNLDGKRPEIEIEQVWPHPRRMQEHGTCVHRNRMDGAFGNAVLMMYIDTTECLRLTVGLAFIYECFGSKDPIITMIMLHIDIECHAMTFEGLLAFYGFLGIRGFLRITINLVGGMIYKDRYTRECSCSGFTTECQYTSRCM